MKYLIVQGLKHVSNSEIIYLLFLSPQALFYSGAHVKFSLHMVIWLCYETTAYIFCKQFKLRILVSFPHE